MFKTQLSVARWIVILFVTALLSNPAVAAKPEQPGQGKGNAKVKVHKAKHADKSHKADKAHSDKNAAHAGGGDDGFFGDSHRDIIRDYYGNEFKSGHCPPGLAKKNNGCLPPGQAKKWQRGHRLPGDVVYHDLPNDLLRRLGHNDPAYKLIRVGSDILKIGVGSGLVIEAVEDLGGLF